MKAKIKYKALTSRGNHVYKTVTHEFPDFEEKSGEVSVNGGIVKIPYTTTVEMQIMDHLDRMDKTDLMYENDWYAIIDYWPVKKKEKKKSVKVTVAKLATEYLAGLNNGPQLAVDFLAVYARMFPKVKDLSAEKQFTIVLEAMGIGYEAQSEVYKRTIAMLRGEDEEYNQRLTEYKNQHGNQIQGAQGEA